MLEITYTWLLVNLGGLPPPEDELNTDITEAGNDDWGYTQDRKL